MIRIAEDSDADAIAHLVNADPVPGQPMCRAEDVRRAMAGAATMERAWWDAFTDLTTIVATDSGSVLPRRVQSTGTSGLATSCGCMRAKSRRSSSRY